VFSDNKGALPAEQNEELYPRSRLVEQSWVFENLPEWTELQELRTVEADVILQTDQLPKLSFLVSCISFPFFGSDKWLSLTVLA
jgi:hypothetical protein